MLPGFKLVESEEVWHERVCRKGLKQEAERRRAS